MHDLETKVRAAKRFLEEGSRVRLTVIFRGREVVHPDIGDRLLQTFVELCGDTVQAVGQPLREARRTSLTVVPRRRG